MSARERMLGRLRAAAPAATADATADADASQLDARIDAHYDARREAATPAELAQAMQAALSASHARAWCASAEAWPAQLAGRLAAAGVRRLLLDPAAAQGAALMRALPASVATLSYARPIEAWKAELFDTVDAGFTVARSGIAATGTLVLAPDAQTPRTVSLVPPLHIALVYAETLHPDLHCAARAERWSAGMPTNLVLVSGPSKTSDIQQTLAYGAHGPRELWVIIVTGSAGTGAAQ
ncbi:LUD domain-containing protein [Cupriavidus sp. UME77]|uniref:LutC/YkgG family protein n=1 Tax=Cupriavidus sp. UME77 TaxID=1862321 RepID=UPI001602204A|nr:LUD domain-containing protein [Cupriavidus sp. UME77]MBB1633603.1 lactate utilization protein C [Cupriavidus sp. UME77]